MSNLKGKTALVTGASRGIGRASALALAQAGAQVLVHYSSSEKEADAVVAEIRKGGGKAEKVAADLRKPDGAQTLVKHFAAALGPRGIRVNAVAPGVVETDMSNFTKTDAGREFTLGMQALKRLAQPDDIAPVVAFLASDDARWVTGHSIHVDGGSKL
jgi:NAD(P)-dependent dehydrogenase (short-subunit alcohol dehydrogenase family)